jgi:2-oxoglutarate ferredoxin oxidoreductase subunit beta
VISPCVTFNDHEGSTKSYKYMKEHEEPVNEVGFVPHFENITVEYEPGTATEVRMHDGSLLQLRKVGHEYDPTNRIEAIKALHESTAKGEVLTGVFYVDTQKANFVDLLHLVDEPLATLPQEKVRPPKEVLDKIMQGLM